jgi:imidazolonepropionase-like amidohydrolase
MTERTLRPLLAAALLALTAGAVAADDCPVPDGAMIRIPQPGQGNLVVCGSRFLSGFPTGNDTAHCVYVCDGLVTGSIRQRRPHLAAAGTAFVHAEGLWVVPGFVDLRTSAGRSHSANEESSEVTPAFSALDLVDPGDAGFQQALESGVTSVAISPGARAVIGGTTAIVKTDDRALGHRLLALRAALSATLGYEPTFGNRAPRWGAPRGYYYRRPGNRMGLSAELERSFFTAREGRIDDPITASIMSAAMEGTLPVTFRARKDQDIRTVLRLSDEFGLRPVIFEGTEAWRRAADLAERDVPVVLGPLYQQPRGGTEAWEGDDPRSAVGALLEEAGVTVAFASGPDDPPGSLREWAMLSVRHGMDRKSAFLGITSRPAEILGLAERIGRLSWGTDADMVVMDGHPLDPTSRVLMTIVNGRVAWAHEDAPPVTTVDNPSASLIRTGDPR